jgi:hypothetical protein
VRRRFYGLAVNNPLCVVFNGAQGDGKSRLILDITGLVEDYALAVKNASEIFTDNRGFKLWQQTYILAIHEMGILDKKYAEPFKDMIDALTTAGRTMQQNGYDKIDVVTSMIGATNKQPTEVLTYDPNNRKVVFLPFLRLTPLNRDNIITKRDEYRKAKFLQRWFLSIDETQPDPYDDNQWYQSFVMWLKPRNAEHTLTQKFLDMLIYAYAGKAMTASEIYDTYLAFHGAMARENKEGQKALAMKSKKFGEFINPYLTDAPYVRGRREKLVPSPREAYERGYDYLEPEDEVLDYLALESKNDITSSNTLDVGAYAQTNNRLQVLEAAIKRNESN